MEPASILRERIQRLEAEKADLELLLATSSEHYDQLEHEFRETIQGALSASMQKIETLKEQIRALENEKADLETIMDASVDHMDVMEDELLSKIRTTIATAERRFRLICESIPMPVLVSRKTDWTILYANAHASKLFAPEEDIAGRSLLSLLASPDRGPLMTVVERENAVENREVRGVRADGSTFWAMLTLKQFSFNDEVCLLSVWNDITERRILEGQLRQAHKMEAIGTFAAGIAHDFNNLLSAIFGFAQLGICQMPEDSPAVESIEKLITAGNRAKDLVKQILTFARMSDPEMKPLRIASTVMEATNLIQQLMTSSIRIKVDLRDSDSIIMGDATQIHQVLMNLGVNAVDAMRDTGGGLEITLEEVGPEAVPSELPGLLPAHRYALLTVADTGQGIPKEILGMIFDPFFTTKKQGKGTGMGLSVVDGIVRTHGGSIQLESEVGRGTTFRIYFPCAAAGMMVEEAAPAKTSGPIKGTKRVLLVDDHEDILASYPALLQTFGFLVQTEKQGMKALARVQADPMAFDLVITTDGMVDLESLALAIELKEIRRDLPVLLWSGGRIPHRGEPANPVIDRTLVKPCTLEELVATIRSILPG